MRRQHGFLDLRSVTVIIAPSPKDAPPGSLYWPVHCEKCSRPLGASPEAYAFHQQSPTWRPFMCLTCGMEFAAIMRAAESWTPSELRELHELQQAQRWLN